MLTPYNATGAHGTHDRSGAVGRVAPLGFLALVSFLCALAMACVTAWGVAYDRGYRQAVQDSYAAGYYMGGASDALLRF